MKKLFLIVAIAAPLSMAAQNFRINGDTSFYRIGAWRYEANWRQTVATLKQQYGTKNVVVDRDSVWLGIVRQFPKPTPSVKPTASITNH